MFGTAMFDRDAAYRPSLAPHSPIMQSISALAALCDQGADHVRPKRHCS